ncbi:Putative uncharacterized transposon-derived protein F52C9.6 [Eumeta japonica]|uniref:Uncharacterized transposon-derived protein F52C9.6 n=1 Tax=Eumeta variegata TaxID=151549 RepID=A0A4C1TD60_EUMVA|nr:Putative uncharacterized transposon-derived protein F52C9.6 [Eumeta japonica]
MKVRKNFKDIYITEDYTKEVLEKRKLLQTRLKEERMKGNFAYLKYDKLVVKENNITKEKKEKYPHRRKQHPNHRMVRAKLSGSHTKKARKFHNSMRAIECTGDTDLLLNNLDISLQNGEKENECISIQEKYTNLLQQLKLETKKVNMISKTEISLKKIRRDKEGKKRIKPQKDWIPNMKDKDKRKTSKRSEILGIATDYYKNYTKVEKFNIGARNDFQKSELDQNGLNINGENLNHLRFADDLILFSEDARTLEIMLQQLSDESVKAAYRQIKWRWTGHMSRENIEKWSRLVTEWYPRDGKRSRGRPNKRWEDDLRKIAGPVWSRLARDRDKWKSLEEAFVDRQAVQQKQPVAD